MTAKHHSWRISGLLVTNNGTVLEMWVDAFFYGKKKMNGPEENHIVGCLGP